MRLQAISSLFLSLIALVIIHSCTKDKGKIGNGYPEEISKILVNKCATPGCHTQASKNGAAGLALETWDQLFEGDRNGAVCIPYSHEYSTIFLFTNTYKDLGVSNEPTMPLNKPALSREEITTLTNWIDAGAPSSSGKIAFADNPNRKKVYVANQGCDVVTVFDAATQLPMRYIKVGASPGQIESPHMIKVSADGNYWYVVFSVTGTVLQKFRTSDDSYVGKATLGIGSWNTLSLSNDSKYGFAVDWQPDGRVAHVNLNTMSLMSPNPIWGGAQLLPDAHGSAINKDGDTLYLTSQVGNFIMKVPVDDPGSVERISLNPPSLPSSASLLDPHEIIFSPDNLYYYVSCQKSNEIRVMRVADDALEAIIPTGKYPLEITFSKNPATPYLFVTCEYDDTPPATNRGSVTVINYTTNTVVKNLRTNMAEPHGVAVDDENGLVYVTNRNITGPSIPHHTSNCGGRNGFISFIDLNTLEVIKDKRIEVAVDPYSIAIRD